jgi:hypothetical protein
MLDKDRSLYDLLKSFANDDLTKWNRLTGLYVTNFVYGTGKIKEFWKNSHGVYLYIDFPSEKNALYNTNSFGSSLLFDLALPEELCADIYRYRQDLIDKAKAEMRERDDNLNNIIEIHDIKSLYYIAHINNLKSICMNGFQCRNYLKAKKNSFQDISDANVQLIRAHLHLHEYVNFYFAHNTPMLYVVVNKYSDSVILLELLSLEIMMNAIKFTDGNAASSETIFYDDFSFLSNLEWNIIKSKHPATVGHAKRVRSAEVLVKDHVKPTCIKCVHVASNNTKQTAISILRGLGKYIPVKEDLTAEGIK